MARKKEMNCSAQTLSGFFDACKGLAWVKGWFAVQPGSAQPSLWSAHFSEEKRYSPVRSPPTHRRLPWLGCHFWWYAGGALGGARAGGPAHSGHQLPKAVD